MILLRDLVRRSHHLLPLQPRTSPAQPSMPGVLGLLPRLRDEALTFLFAGSTSSEAEHISQRHTHAGTRTGNADMASHTDCHRHGAAFNSTHIWESRKTK